MVLGNCLLPGAFGRIKPVELLQSEFFPTLTVVRGDIQNVEPASDPSASTNLRNCISGEHRGESQVFLPRAANRAFATQALATASCATSALASARSESIPEQLRRDLHCPVAGIVVHQVIVDAEK